MNPPFERQQDIDHVNHAWKFVMLGGRLVAIMSAGILFRENRKTKEFIEIVNTHGYIERLPENSFRDAGTGVNTCLVVMDKPKNG
jgi:type I restriction-modification system DNA methylase subunit